jgi:hypothetical protein
MERIPLHDRLRKRGHRKVALAQDLLVSAAYDAFPAMVLHGGTAIWRCFGGSRFSEDVDAYLQPPVEGEALRELRDVLVAKGFVVLKLKRSRNAVYARTSYADAEVRFEALVREPGASVVRTFEMVDGSRMAVNTLSAEALLAEKARAYVNRRKVRDLFDVFFLIGLAPRVPEAESSVGELIDGFVPPVDEGALKALVISGAVPTTEGMMEAIRKWARSST